MSRASDPRVRMLLIGYRGFSELINSVTQEFADQVDVNIVESLAGGNTDYHDLVAKRQPDVVASAGSNAAYLAATLSVPVISQQVTDTDVIEALATARRLSRRIHLFLYQPENTPSPRLFQSLPGLLDVDVVFHSYSTARQASQLLHLALAEDSPQVVVGPSYICHLAEQQGVPGILVYSQESARAMLREAIDVGRHQAHMRVGDDQSDKQQTFVIRSDNMKQLARLVRTYARGPASVLIHGESGTGKEHIARELHRHSDFSSGELVAVNCGSIPNELFESELFGYADGAFTSSRRGGRVGLVERANGGVLYLDEVGEMPLSQQVKLLRVLQEKRIRPVGANREIPLDFKVIAATNRDLREAVRQGEFRDDLYYRLNVFSLSLPPLRERPEDVEDIAHYYLREYGFRYDVNFDAGEIFQSILRVFRHYHWPGNVRELQNFIERLVVNLQADPTGKFSEAMLSQILPELFLPVPDGGEQVASLRQREEIAIREAMQAFNGDKSQVAQHLGISTTTLWRRLRELDSVDINQQKV